MTNTSVAHLSDPHLVTGPLAGEPAAGLHRALGRVLSLRPRPACVVITGDLVDRGRPDGYPVLAELLRGYPLPVHLAAGNHDNHKALLDTFGGTRFLADGNATNYAAVHPGVTVIVLDSSRSAPDPQSGSLDAGQLAWLDATLARHTDRPALVCLHHPPVPVGIPFLDGMRVAPQDADALAATIARHPHTARILAGHVHRPITAAFAGTTVAIAPSTYRQTDLAMCDEHPIGYVHEPTAFLLHLVADRTPTPDDPSRSSCVTHTVAVSHTTAPTGHF
ncbi:metallophosphoesterase [Yinghuangia soli]|uniref:Metallophosphoesterase n=1 Tax=Yinghuangia soli TaxID=2908204 RepID=A0AA41Q383_9ACTN|nr:metallophosphoesterase [Yinghuangia soli]MCF2530738.1 metallophosphoesterase [Yinghuangia soli]